MKLLRRVACFSLVALCYASVQPVGAQTADASSTLQALQQLQQAQQLGNATQPLSPRTVPLPQSTLNPNTISPATIQRMLSIDPNAGQSPHPPSNDPNNPPQDPNKAEAPLISAHDALPDNEFQRFVFSATGSRLGVFGQSYFMQTERTFAPSERIPVPADYVLGPGDELFVRVWGSIDVDLRVTVDRNGLINLPRVGAITMAGVKVSEAETVLRSQIGRVFRNFSLNVTLGQLRSMQIFVVGQARKPGSYTVSSLSTLINAIFASGGPNTNGSLRHIQLKRNAQVVSELDLYDFILNGDKTQDVRLQSGDTVVFLPKGPQIALLGSLDNPAIFELKGSTESAATVLRYAGLSRISVNRPTALLERVDSLNTKSPRSVNTLKLDDQSAEAALLRDGDMLTLFGLAPAFGNAITLRGTVAAPLRYPYAPGMRISQLIPDREALITPDYYQRKNRLVQFAAPTTQAAAAVDVNQVNVEHDVRNIVDEPNWEYAVVERLNRDDLTMQVLPFNLGKAVIKHDPEHDLVLQPGDVVTIFGINDVSNPISRRTRLVRVEGEVQAPGIYQVRPGESLRSLITRVGGMTPEAYVFGTEFNRATTKATQQAALNEAVNRLENQLASAGADQAANLVTSDAQTAMQLRAAHAEARKAQISRLRSIKSTGRIALELDPTTNTLNDLPDIPLEDGDRIYIPHRPGFVLVVGAVANTNGLLWREGKRLRDYLNVAGVEPDANEAGLFVVRADGSVEHNHAHRGWLDSSLDNLKLMPGDTVVVPEKTDRETFWTTLVRGLKDWSQIFYQFGLTAAAIHTLRL
ncbi:MAG: SLBB domain-containing protein [Leptothrix ochracea]|uniref:SLBB domain-containing protein n=1 Tax=Leptothrix ochracea TaxID=735331 RepID=UPI0034E21352